MNSTVAWRQMRVLMLLALASVLANQSLEAALVASYSFENGSTADGATADGSQNLTLFGNANVSSPGIFGNGKLSLDGSGDYANSPSPGTNGFTNSAAVTLATWFTTTAITGTTQQVLIHIPIQGGTAAQAAAGLEIMAGKLQVGGRSVNTDPFRSNDATLPANTLTINSNTTYFAAAVIDYANDQVTAYLYDGAVWKIQSVSAAFTNLGGSGNQGFNLGRRADGQRFFNGSIDDVKIFNEALSEAAVKALTVPEPSTLLILAVMVTGLSGRRRSS
jgi:hypothetical protein